MIRKEEKYIAHIRYADEDYCGVIINRDKGVVSFYDLAVLRAANLHDSFIAHCEIWWWESNRLIPINIFIGFDVFKQYSFAIKTFATKRTVISSGYVTDLKVLIKHQRKKKTFLVKRKRR